MEGFPIHLMLPDLDFFPYVGIHPALELYKIFRPEPLRVL